MHKIPTLSPLLRWNMHPGIFHSLGILCILGTKLHFRFAMYTTPMSVEKKERLVSLSQMPEVAREVLARVRKSARGQASVLALSGELGAGKTTFTQALAKHLGVEEDITSPTFVIEKRYRTSDPDFTELLHIDAYRLDEAKELTVLDFGEMLKDPKTLIVIEWAERVSELLPEGTIFVTFTHIDESTRRVAYA